MAGFTLRRGGAESNPKAGAVFVALAVTLATPAALAQVTPELNATERATVRIFGCRSLALEPVQHEGRTVYLAVPDVGHGSGLVVTEDGLILTARHVVDGMSGLAVKLPLSDRILPAVVVSADPLEDVAFIKVMGQFPDHVALPAAADVRAPATRDVLFSIGYPLDPSASTPTTQQGIVSRQREDGMLQTTAALNPGHSGGPVFADAGGEVRLVGVAMARHRDAEGMGLVVPIMPAIEAYQRDVVAGRGVARAFERFERDPQLWRTMERYSTVVADMTEAFYDRTNPSFWFTMPSAGPGGVPSFLRELQSLAVDSMLPEAQLLVSGYLWNLFVATRDQTALQASIDIVVHLRTSEPTVFGDSLFAQSLMRVVEEIGAMIGDGTTPTGGPTLCGGEGQPCCDGECAASLSCESGLCVPDQGCSEARPCPGGDLCSDGVCEPPPPFPLFRLGVVAGMAIDDSERAQTPIDGGGAGVIALFQPLRLGHLHRWAFAVVTGAELYAGEWRRAVVFTGLVDLGVRVLVGSPRVAAALALLYTPGVAVAEGRTSGVYLAYRLMVGIQVGRLDVALSWRETGRTADSTFRALEIVATWGIR